jgi:radical SAM protein with 4Fe4S-binding SPASM domain
MNENSLNNYHNSNVKNAPPLRIVFWETTVRCNLACRHCRRISLKPSDELSHEESLRLIDQIQKLSYHHINTPLLIFSGGEPLLREDVFELAAYAKKAKVATALATNGTLIDSSMAVKIAKAGFGRIAVSLDGPINEIHDEIRGLAGCFDGALAGISEARSAKIPVQINTTISQRNLKVLPEMLELVTRLQAMAWHVFIFVPVGCGVKLPAGEMLSGEQAEKVLHWLYEVSQRSEIQIKPTCAPQYYRLLAERGALQPGTMWHRYTRGCLAGINVCFVSSTGKVFPCGYLPTEAGDVRKESLADIWYNSKIFRDLRDFTLLKGACGGCKDLVHCGGCRARAYSVFGNMLAEDPGCPFFTKNENA